MCESIPSLAGRRADALKIAKEVEEVSSHSYVDFYQVATIYAGLGEKDEVFRSPTLSTFFSMPSASKPLDYVRNENKIFASL